MKALTIIEFGLLSGICFGVAVFWQDAALVRGLYFLLGVLWFLVGKFVYGVLEATE